MSKHDDCKKEHDHEEDCCKKEQTHDHEFEGSTRLASI